MLSYNELKPGVFIIVEGKPWEVLEYEFLRMQQRKPVSKTKLRNMVTGAVQDRTFHQNDSIYEAEIEKRDLKYLYGHKGEHWFSYPHDPSKRFKIEEEKLQGQIGYLMPNIILTALTFNGEVVGTKLPIKAEYKVIEAPPAIKGDTASGGNKAVTIESGAKVNVPLFINVDDIIRINTETGAYVERVEKA